MGDENVQLIDSDGENQEYQNTDEGAMAVNGTSAATRPIKIISNDGPQRRTPTEPRTDQKEYKTPRWMPTAMIGMAVLIVVMLTGIVVGIFMITREREEIKEIRNEYSGLERNLSTMNISLQQADRKLGQDTDEGAMAVDGTSTATRPKEIFSSDDTDEGAMAVDGTSTATRPKEIISIDDTDEDASAVDGTSTATRRGNIISNDGPQCRTPTEPPTDQKEYMTSRWMLKAMIGMAVLIVVMLTGIVVGIVMTTKEREEIKEIRNEYSGLERIVSTMNTSLQQAYRKLGQEYSGLERNLSTMNISLQQADRKLEQDVLQLRAIACNIWYDNKCFFPLINNFLNRNSASKSCKEIGGGLANIYSSDHLTLIMNSLRQTKMGGVSSANFYLGMKIIPSNGSVTLSDGAPAPYLKWCDGFPLTDYSYTCVGLNVNVDSSAIGQYLLNFPPTAAASVLCEIA